MSTNKLRNSLVIKARSLHFSQNDLSLDFVNLDGMERIASVLRHAMCPRLL